MRNPSLILAAALFAAATASAAGDGWRNVRFKDEAGVEHSLWCKTSECGPGTKGTATLYAFDNEKSVTSTTEEGYLWWKKTTSATQKTFDAKVSSYSLDLAANKAVAGTKSFPVENQAALPPQVSMTVAVSQAAADDLPTALTPAEKYWLADTERKEYDRQSAQSMKPEARQKLQSMTRSSMVTKHLPSFAQAQYKKLTTGAFDPVKVSTYLDGLVSIKDPEDLKKLEEIKKGQGAGARLERENGLVEYKTQMATIKLGADGRPDPRFRDIAVKKVAEFRGLLRAHGGKAPGKQPGAPAGHGPSVVLDLTASELDWLTNEQRGPYEEKVKTKLSDADRLQLDKEARENVKANLPVSGRAGYEAALAEMTPSGIDAALAKVPHYSGDQARLIPAEVEALAKITKKENPNVQGDNAQVDYKREMATVRKVGDAYPKSEHLHAHAIALKYRQILADAKVVVPGAPPAEPKPGEAPGQQPGQKPPKPRKLKVSDEDLAYLTKKNHDDYKVQWDEAAKQPAGQKRDDALADIAAKYQAIVDDVKAMKPPVTSQDFAGLTDNQKAKFCEPFGPMGGPAPSKTEAARPQLEAAAGSTARADATMEGDTHGGAAAGPGPGVPLTPEQKKHEAELRASCREYAQNQAAKNPTPNLGGAGAVPAPPSKDCAKPKKGADGKVDPSAQAGSDKDTSCPDPDENTFDKKHPAFYKNLANGVTMGMFGLIVGSFFGGPAVMALAAVTMGAGAFALSAHFNPPPKKKDGA